MATVKSVRWTDLGRRAYAEVWQLQQWLVAEHKAGRGVDRLLLVEHDPVITLGRRASEEHLLLDRQQLAARGIQVYDVERAGDVTYHGPGQLVAYPILDLRHFRRDVRWFSQALLETAIRTLAAFGIPARARTGLETGVWVEHGGEGAKIAALGLRLERWISYHGLALNVDPDLTAFELIVPCGLTGTAVVSMAELLGRSVSLAQVRPHFLASFGAVFGVQLRAESPAEVMGP